jgi:hypothetical protein
MLRGKALSPHGAAPSSSDNYKVETSRNEREQTRHAGAKVRLY